MFLHSISIAVLALVLIGCLFLPFLPGEYDALAAGLATMTALFGVSGLLFLVPSGLAWLLYEILTQRSRQSTSAAVSKDFYFALAATICSLPVAALVTIGALVTLGSSAAVIVGTLIAFGLWRLMLPLRRLKSADPRRFHPAPLYLIILPTIVVGALLAFGSQAKEFSRHRAMDNAQPLIADIEAYRQRTGKYPESLHSEVEDYQPRIRGTRRYYYEPSGEAYNVFFEQFTLTFGTQEFVVYNAQDKQEFTTHNQDLLRLDPSQIYRGYHAVLDSGQPHWKTFLFD